MQASIIFRQLLKETIARSFKWHVRCKLHLHFQNTKCHNNVLNLICIAMSSLNLINLRAGGLF